MQICPCLNDGTSSFCNFLFSLSDSRSLAIAKMGEGLEGRTKVLSDDKFKALNKALKIDKKKPQGE